MNHLGTCMLETNRLYLRRFCQEDIEDCLHNWASDQEVFQFISQAPMSREDWAIFLAGANAAYAMPTTYYWAIEYKGTHSVIGEIFVDDFSERNSWCEIDYKIGVEYWGQGIAVEALQTVISYLFDQVKFHRIQAKCSIYNTASERVMQKAGMSREGVLREYFRCKNRDGYDDVVMYSILQDNHVLVN